MWEKKNYVYPARTTIWLEKKVPPFEFKIYGEEPELEVLIDLDVEVEYNGKKTTVVLEGSEYNGKCFVSIKEAKEFVEAFLKSYSKM